jgi:hypothetical protein
MFPKVIRRIDKSGEFKHSTHCAQSILSVLNNGQYIDTNQACVGVRLVQRDFPAHFAGHEPLVDGARTLTRYEEQISADSERNVVGHRLRERR